MVLQIKKEQIKLIIDHVKQKARLYNDLAKASLEKGDYSSYRYYHATAFENELFLIDLESLLK